jgi:hypothetical protein
MKLESLFVVLLYSTTQHKEGREEEKGGNIGLVLDF